MRPELVGVLPEKLEPQPSYPIVHCAVCGAATVYAYDDRFPETRDILHRRQVDFEPEEDRGRGDLVLWYEVDGAGEPMGPQWFRRIGDITGEHAGSVWRYHRNTCKGGVFI
jgi:hypothetical protein